MNGLDNATPYVPCQIPGKGGECQHGECQDIARNLALAQMDTGSVDYGFLYARHIVVTMQLKYGTPVRGVVSIPDYLYNRLVEDGELERYITHQAKSLAVKTMTVTWNEEL